jgi:N-acetyl sugar amidotransferase
MEPDARDISCLKCGYPITHPLGLIVNSNGVCSGCQTHDEKYQIDWPAKEIEFMSILDNFVGKSSSGYDCIIPVFGTGDDFYVVDKIKNQYGLNPLLITYNSHYYTKIGVRNLARLITELDCDHLISTASPSTVKKITRYTFEKYGDLYWHVVSGQQVFAAQVSVKLNIPLIVWGVNGWLDQVGMFSHYQDPEMTKKIWQEHVCRGISLDEISENTTLTKKDFKVFDYPDDKTLARIGTKGVYLGNYFFWDSKGQVESMISKYNFETGLQERTYNTYESVHCSVQSGVQDYLKYIKFGYSRVHDDVAKDIRLKRLSLQDADCLVRYFSSITPSSLEPFYQWLGIDQNEFESIVLKLDSRDGKDTAEIIRDDVNDVVSKLEYAVTPLLEEQNFTEEFILLGRSFIDAYNFKAVEG